MKRTLRSIGALATAALALAGCGTMTVNPLVQFLDDSGTTTAIKTRLATEGGIGSLTGIGVRTRDDIVTLTGTVADDTERQRAEAIARRIAGDNRVISELKVANSASASVSDQKYQK
jgi:osmotically-inducible protein OsmY